MTDNKKTINTLVEDIYRVFTDIQDEEISEENLERLGEEVKEAVKNSIKESSETREPHLRMSKLGTPNRKLWFEMNTFNPPSEGEIEEMEKEAFEHIESRGSLAIKFLYGHILEAVLLFLVREAGHEVEGEQDTLSIDGLEGHRDCKIDGVTVDVKTASKFAFSKFKQGTLLQDDPFGYVAQLSGYIQADNGGRLDEGGAFLVLNKESGEITLLEIDPMDTINAGARVEEVKTVVNFPEPPVEKCYEPQPLGKSGNIVLNRNCVWCPFKEMCWANDANNGEGLKKFRYSDGIKYFTHIEALPSVPEVTD